MAWQNQNVESICQAKFFIEKPIKMAQILLSFLFSPINRATTANFIFDFTHILGTDTSSYLFIGGGGGGGGGGGHM